MSNDFEDTGDDALQEDIAIHEREPSYKQDKERLRGIQPKDRDALSKGDDAGVMLFREERSVSHLRLVQVSNPDSVSAFPWCQTMFRLGIEFR